MQYSCINLTLGNTNYHLARTSDVPCFGWVMGYLMLLCICRLALSSVINKNYEWERMK
jgi:hypothetical protein